MVHGRAACDTRRSPRIDLSLIADAGGGKRVQVALGHETGNVVFDSVYSAAICAIGRCIDLRNARAMPCRA
jgi:hypothetical protein